VGLLTFIVQTGNVLLGGLTLFFMGLGVGSPLLIIGLLGGKFLPKLHSWQSSLQVFFGLILIAIAIWLVSRVLSPTWIMFMWSALVIITAVYMGILKETSDHSAWKLWRALSIMVLIYGIALFFGALIGSKNPLNPLSLGTQIQTSKTLKVLSFKNINNDIELQEAINKSVDLNKPILLDFYADWCATCKIMDEDIFYNPGLQTLLSQFTLLRVDLTDVNGESIQLAKKMNVGAPPVIIFYDQKGAEFSQRIEGEIKANDFRDVANQMLTH
jgi:thiol:disulfide interchange protein DsbD